MKKQGGENLYLIKKNCSKEQRQVLTSFKQEFGDIFNSPNPSPKEIDLVFRWLKVEAESALSFNSIDIIDCCRRFAEVKLTHPGDYNERVLKKSQMVLRALKGRFDELRTTKRVIKGRFSPIQAHKEEEKALPSN